MVILHTGLVNEPPGNPSRCGGTCRYWGIKAPALTITIGFNKRYARKMGKCKKKFPWC